MKLVFSKSNLLRGVGIVLKAVPTRTTMSILENLYPYWCYNEWDKVYCQYYGTWYRNKGWRRYYEKGKIAIDAKIFSEIVRKLPDNDITIETDSNFTSFITCEKSKFNITAGKSGEDFSYLPIIEKEKSIKVSQFS